MRIPASLMLVLLLTHQSSSQCHSCEHTSCNCSRQNLRTIPASPSESITELDLSFNRLETVAKDDFVGYTSLRSLMMNNNRIRAIQEKAFVRLTHLEKLDLSLNSLDTLSAGWFEKLSSLRHLNLLGNEYKTLGQGRVFQSLKRLKTLHLGGPNLQSVAKNDFSGLSCLEEFVFDGQNLKEYAVESLRETGPIEHVTLRLNGPFRRDPGLVRAVLTDVADPNTTLTFSDIFFLTKIDMLPFKVVANGGTRAVCFKSVNITAAACTALLSLLSDSNVTTVAFEDIKFFITFERLVKMRKMRRLEKVLLKNIDTPEYYNFPALFFLQPIWDGVRWVSLVKCKFYALPCEVSVKLTQLEYADFTDNFFTDLTLGEMMCNGKGALIGLRTLNISRNHLQSINSELFTKLDRLQNLDMSGNVFHGMPEMCRWPPSLQFLNLSSMYLTKVTPCLPVTLRILDVSKNALTVSSVHLPSLTELYISGNKLSCLPDGRLYPRLAVLSIPNNGLQTLSSDVLNQYKSLKSLEAAANTYICACDFVAFVTSDLAYRGIATGDELKSYICDSPDGVRGKSVADARLSVFECHTALALSLLCLGILAAFLLVAGLCHRFSVVWYTKMTWAWLRAKRKPKLRKGECQYDAFVSYSEMDSGWVEAHLVPELELGEPPLQLCLHKRDFIPGGRILDNIMDAIEKSHRTVFVLSQHFVSSEWCKYELDYTHFRLFDHNDDAAVLVLLEPIDKDAIPKRFCKLRKVMNSRTYLEWPDDDNQIPRFWQSLRAAVVRPAADDGDADGLLNDTVGL